MRVRQGAATALRAWGLHRSCNAEIRQHVCLVLEVVVLMHRCLESSAHRAPTACAYTAAVFFRAASDT